MLWRGTLLQILNLLLRMLSFFHQVQSLLENVAVTVSCSTFDLTGLVSHCVHVIVLCHSDGLSRSSMHVPRVPVVITFIVPLAMIAVLGYHWYHSWWWKPCWMAFMIYMFVIDQLINLKTSSSIFWWQVQVFVKTKSSKHLTNHLCRGTLACSQVKI